MKLVCLIYRNICYILSDSIVLEKPGALNFKLVCQCQISNYSVQCLRLQYSRTALDDSDAAISFSWLTISLNPV